MLKSQNYVKITKNNFFSTEKLIKLRNKICVESLSLCVQLKKTYLLSWEIS